jgi:hypothetical protein
VNGNGGEAVWTVNRAVVVLRPKEPFVKWVRSVDRTAEPVEEDLIRSTSTAFLIPDFDFAEESWEWIKEYSSLFFDLELNDWYADEATWPSDRSWEVLEEWFEIELIDTAWDLVDEPPTSNLPEP